MSCYRSKRTDTGGKGKDRHGKKTQTTKLGKMEGNKGERKEEEKE
jgi:hypothetical protein